MPGWPPPSYGRCSPSSMCKVSHLTQVCNTHSQLSSGQATGLAHTDMCNLAAVDPINTLPGVHKTSGDSGSPIGISLVLDKAPCLAQTSISAEHLDSPGDVQQTGTAHADSPGEAVIASGMSSPTEPQSTAITKPDSTGLVLAKGSVCVPCSPITLAASHFKNDEA